MFVQTHLEGNSTCTRKQSLFLDTVGYLCRETGARIPLVLSLVEGRQQHIYLSGPKFCRPLLLEDHSTGSLFCVSHNTLDINEPALRLESVLGVHARTNKRDRSQRPVSLVERILDQSVLSNGSYSSRFIYLENPIFHSLR